MRKIKMFLLLLVLTLSFSIGTNYIKAANLPTCNIGFGDGTYKGYGNVTAGAPSKVNEALSAGITRIHEEPSNGFNSWAPSKKFTIHMTARSRKDNLGRIEKFNIIFYHDKDPDNGHKEDYAMCQLTQDDFSGYGNPYFDVNFDITNGHIEYMMVDMTYNFEGETKTIDEKIIVRKELGNTQSVSNTTTAAPTQNGTAASTTREKITVSDNSYVDEDENDYATGYGATMDKSNIGGGSTENACNSVNALFDYFWPYVMIIIPAALIVLIAIDFFKAMASNDNDAIKKAGTNTVKRTIAAVVLLALPAIVRLIFGLVELDFCL